MRYFFLFLSFFLLNYSDSMAFGSLDRQVRRIQRHVVQGVEHHVQALQQQAYVQMQNAMAQSEEVPVQREPRRITFTSGPVDFYLTHPRAGEFNGVPLIEAPQTGDIRDKVSEDLLRRSANVINGLFKRKRNTPRQAYVRILQLKLLLSQSLAGEIYDGIQDGDFV